MVQVGTDWWLMVKVGTGWWLMVKVGTKRWWARVWVRIPSLYLLMQLHLAVYRETVLLWEVKNALFKSVLSNRVHSLESL
jgi:hypothetical protein